LPGTTARSSASSAHGANVQLARGRERAVRFQMSLADAKDGSKFGEADIPFIINR
jgi:hypothetical protein